MIRLLGASVALLACVGAAEAAPATPEEAQRLTALFERYVGHPAGQSSAVSVVPDGNAYKATLDPARLFGFLSAEGYAVTSTPLVAQMAPQDDGRWRVTIDGLPIVGFTKADQAFSMSINGYKLDGLFDPRIQAFASATTVSNGTMTHGAGPKGSADVTLTETANSAYSATDAGGSTIDVKANSTIKDLTYRFESKTPADGPDGKAQSMDFTAKAGSLTSALSLGNERVVAVNDLWAFLVAHSSKETLVAAQAELKAKLKALLPFASSATGDVALHDLAVTTTQGTFGVGEFSEHYAFGGASGKDGVFTALKLSGLTLPAALVPAWAAPLVPTSVDFNQSYGPVNITPALTMAIDDLDLSSDKLLTAEQQASVMQALSGGDMKIAIAPSTIATALMSVKFEGDMVLTKPMPTGTATVSVTGLDKTIDQVRAVAPEDPNAAQAIAFLSAVKVLAKAEGLDSYSWKVVAAPGAEVTVNGNPLSGGPKAKPRKQKKVDLGPDQRHAAAPAQ